MARPIRIDCPDTFYHVLSRGNERKEIFRDEKDYQKFLDLVGRMVDRFQLEVHAYVLMKNHYHLLIRTRIGDLSRSIQWLGVSYSVWFNRRHGRSGHLFQGRFKSFIIENDAYFTAMCLYVHGNPVRAGVVRRLREYRWSSYQTYAGERSYVPWLATDLVLAMYGGSRSRFREAQRRYVDEKVSPLGDLRSGLYLGKEALVREMLERVRREGGREKPQGKELLRERRGVRSAVFEVLEVLEEKDPASVLKIGKRLRPNRDVAIFVLWRQGMYTNREIGETFGIGYTAVTGAARRGEKYLLADERLKRKVERIVILNDM